MKEENVKCKKTIARGVGAGALKSARKNKTSIINPLQIVGVGRPLGDPHIEAQTKTTSKAYLNLMSKFQTLTSNTKAGITLIALIITIIVMLILIGVTVSIAINGGLFANAKQAKSDTQNAINAENSLSNGRIQIDGVWYDSMEAYLAGTKSDNQEDNKDEDVEGQVGDWSTDKDADGHIIAKRGKVTLKVGDYVNYEELIKTKTPNTTQVMNDLATYSGYAEAVKSNEITTGKTYSESYPLTQEKDLKWRVLDVKDGKLRLISAYPTTSKVYLYGYNGYNNGVYLLDEVCDSLYTVTEKGKAQNLKIEDIQDAMDSSVWDFHDYVDETTLNGVTKKYVYGSTEDSALHGLIINFYPEILAREKTGYINYVQGTEFGLSEQKSLINQSNTLEASESVKATQTYWEKTLEETNWTDNVYQNIFIDIEKLNSELTSYLLSSRSVILEPQRFMFLISGVSISSSRVSATSTYSTDGVSWGNVFSYRPVVTLSNDVQIKDEIVGNTWQINQ